MADLKGIKLNIGLDSVSSVSVISRNTVSYSISCNNTGTHTLNVSCPINQAHRNIDTVYEVVSPYSDLALSGYSTEIDLIKNQNYTVSKTTLSGPPNDASVAVNIDAEWLLTNNTPNSYTLASEKIPNYNSIMFPLGPDTCVSMSITDTIYQLKFTFNTNVVLTPINSGDNAYQALDNITTRSITGSSTSASYTSTLDVKVNYIWLNITSMGIIPCGGSAPTPAPVPGVNNAMSRYGVVTDPITKQNSLGLYYGFTASQVGSVFNYGDIDKYKLLIKRDDCFKILIVFILPVFPIFIPIPTWINVVLVNKVTEVITQAVTQANGVLDQAISLAQDVKSQINVKNAAVMAKRGVAVATLVASGKANDDLMQAAKDAALKQLNVIQTAKNYAQVAETLASIQKIIDKVQQILDVLSGLKSLTDRMNIFGSSSSSGDNPTTLELVQASQTAINTINTGIQELIELIEKAPDSVIKRKLQKIIRESQILIEMIKSKAFLLAETIPSFFEQNQRLIDNIVKIIVNVINTFFDIEIIRQAFVVQKELDLTRAAYDLLLEQVDQTGAVKLITELDAKAAKEKKSGLELVATELSNTAIDTIADLVDEVVDILPLKDLENLALAGIDKAQEGVNIALNKLNSAVDDIETGKRNNINSLIGTYLVQNLDLYKISTFGSFDNNNPLDKQIVINDIKGTRIYDINGNLLFEKADFCNQPFIEIAGSLNSNGCKTTDNSPIIDTSPCGSYTCQNFGYWYGIGRFKTSFDFYQNHDLSKGGIRVGDFDGDGMDDLWCHYPGSTKNYDKLKSNEIIYAPLMSRITNNRFAYKQQTLALTKWCKDGVIKIGDFNGDKKSDAICIADTNIYLLYSTGSSFRSASSDVNGLISMSGITNDWTTTANIVTGDFDGDGCSDLLKLTATTITVLFGQKAETQENSDSLFIQKADIINLWSSSYISQLTNCNSVGLNFITVADLNNDGSDDLTCIVNNQPINLYSPITVPVSQQLVSIPTTTIRLLVNEVSFYPIDLTNDIQRKENINSETHQNRIGGGQILISENNYKGQQKTVSGIDMSFGCSNINNVQVEAYLNFQKELYIPETVLWNNALPNTRLTVSVEVSARMLGNSVAELTSNPIQSFTYKLESAPGACYKTQTTTNLVSMSVSYNAVVNVIIEHDGQALSGNALFNEAKKYFNVIKENDLSSVYFNIDGHMTVNILGLGNDVIVDCN